MKKKFLIMLAVALLAVLVVLPATASASITLTTKEMKVVSLINQIRADAGLAELTVKPSLVRAARAHSAEMGAKQYFGHDSLNGDSFAKRLVNHGYVKDGYRVWKAGENVAWGSGLFSTPEIVVDNGMHSDGHRAVILTKSFRNIGIGVKQCEDGFGGCTDPVFFFTLDLGRRVK